MHQIPAPLTESRETRGAAEGSSQNRLPTRLFVGMTETYVGYIIMETNK
jgi:hypothetical protein